jgi:hypothetical protein
MMADQPLSPPQVRAIEALLAHETQGEAAKAARVGQRSIRRWLTQEPFRAALARQRSRLLEDAGGVLARGASKAAASLVEMATGKGKASSPRVAAARAVLDIALRAAELDDVLKRIAELETLAQEAAKQRDPGAGGWKS